MGSLQIGVQAGADEADLAACSLRRLFDPRQSARQQQCSTMTTCSDISRYALVIDVPVTKGLSDRLLHGPALRPSQSCKCFLSCTSA